MKPLMSSRVRMFRSAVTTVAVIVTAAAGCASSPTGPDLGTIDDATEMEQLMDAAALPMARVLTLFDVGTGVPIIDGLTNGAAAAVDRTTTVSLTSPVSCPGGGSAAYAATGITQVTFTNCNLGGVRFSGVLSAILTSSGPSNNQAVIEGGALSMSGGASGTLAITGGLIQWSVPVADATTYWEFRANVGGAPVCVWSGGGSCPQ